MSSCFFWVESRGGGNSGGINFEEAECCINLGNLGLGKDGLWGVLLIMFYL